jgi:hypothetical protein
MPARNNVKTYRLVPSLGTESPLLLQKPLLHHPAGNHAYLVRLVYPFICSEV